MCVPTFQSSRKQGQHHNVVVQSRIHLEIWVLFLLLLLDEQMRNFSVEEEVDLLFILFLAILNGTCLMYYIVGEAQRIILILYSNYSTIQYVDIDDMYNVLGEPSIALLYGTFSNVLYIVQSVYYDYNVWCSD